jgi:hypothetical protein
MIPAEYIEKPCRPACLIDRATASRSEQETKICEAIRQQDYFLTRDLVPRCSDGREDGGCDGQNMGGSQNAQSEYSLGQCPLSPCRSGGVVADEKTLDAHWFIIGLSS